MWDIHVQEAWGHFQKGQGKPVHSSHFVSEAGHGSSRTRRPYQRRRKYLKNAMSIFMAKYREHVQDMHTYIGVVIAAVRDMHAWRRSLMSTMEMMMTNIYL